MKITKTKLREIIRQSIMEEREYDKYFKGMLAKYGVQSPADLSDEEKSKFFTDVDKGWEAKNEGNAFGAAVVAAKKAGKDEFEVDGKTFKVESLSPDVAKHMGSIHKGFKKVEDDGVMVYDSTASAKKASDFLNSKKIAASSDGKYVYLESINESNYDLMFGKLGSGITVSNKKVTDPNTRDYKFIAHISNSGKIDWKDKEAQKNTKVRREVEKRAKSMNESKIGNGDLVRVVDKPKKVMDKSLWGKSGVVMGKDGRHLRIKFTTGRTILVDPKDLELNERKINEGNAFGAAVTQAKKEGKKEFEFNGKTYKVKKGSYEKNEAAKEQSETITESDIKVGSKVVVNYPNLKAPIEGVVSHILKDKNGKVYVLKGDKGVWDESHISLNESADFATTKEIASLTGLRVDAVKKFVDSHNIDDKKLLKYIKGGKLKDRMDFMTAVSGKPGNPIQTKIVKMFGESINERVSVSDERHFGKKGIIIMIDDGGKKVSAIFKDKKNADKYNRNKPEDIKKLLDLAKKTPYPKAIDESVNEGNDFDVDVTQYKKDGNNKLIIKANRSTQPIRENTADSKFKLGTPAVYKHRNTEYSGEVVMNPKNQRVNINGKWVMIGKGTVKGIQTYNNNTFIVPDNWKDVRKFNESVNEGKKRFYQQDNVGSSKYTISYHDGKEKHKDGSDFYGIKIFKNKTELEKFKKDLLQKGYREDSGYKKESVNEGVKLSLVDPNTNKFIKTLSLDRTYKEAEKEVETLNRRLSSSEKTKGLYWKVTSIGESVNEGKKRFYQQDNVGSSKYTISYHDGTSKHKDGSDFYGIKIFKNKTELEKFKKDLLQKGYREDSGYKKESVNEASKKPKFKVGDIVNYLPKLSGMNPNKKLQIIRLRYDEGDKLTSPGWYYSFKGTNLGAHENDIKIAESVNEGKHDVMLDKLASIVKDAKSFMDVGKVLKSNGIKYSFSTSMIPMYKIDKHPIAIVNKKYAAGAEREIGDIAIGLLESIKTK